jgi:acetyl-CoA carboxylase biotin carboxylase subunit
MASKDKKTQDKKQKAENKKQKTEDVKRQTIISSILIANRGEIASRIIRTCKIMGIRSVAVFSEADKDAPFVLEADMAVYIGESNPNLSYLNQDKIIEVCQQYQIKAIHPGYGFLSENAGFARKCREQGIIFIGPNPEAIEAMGSKSNAKTLMKANNVPTIPGYQGEDQSIETLSQEALTIGFPVLLKAAAGGGGKGIRIVHQQSDIENEIEAAKREAQNAFGDDELIIEKYIESGRHIEFQILGDQHGNVVHILERECTIQRRYQKVIEESPSPILTQALREKMGEAAVKAAKAIQYDNAGTVEFIFDDKTLEFFFLEVNTRLQVEHPVTEEITGLDLVQLQIEVAQGFTLPFGQNEIQGVGYAVECRLYAEDVKNDFRPVTGKILNWSVPDVPGLRVESAIQTNSEISIYYDPMIAKIIVWGEDRFSVHRKMSYVLKNIICLGMTTNQDFLIALFSNQAFREGNYDTHFLTTQFDYTTLHTQKHNLFFFSIVGTLYTWYHRTLTPNLLSHLPSGWRSNFYSPQQDIYLVDEEEIKTNYIYQGKQQFVFKIGASEFSVRLIEVNGTQISFAWDKVVYTSHIVTQGTLHFIRNEWFGGIVLKKKERLPLKEAEKLKGGYEAPMPAQVVKVLASVGQSVKNGDPLVVLSSMKMESTLVAEEDGIVEEIYVKAGQNIENGYLLLKLTSNESI